MLTKVKRMTRTMTCAAPIAALVLACSAPADGPSTGTYTVKFPSTAAAVATDTVQLLVFDAPQAPAERAGFCETLIQGRKRKEPQKPLVTNQPVNICELLRGRKPITIDNGDKAILALAQRSGVDFMIGCALQTVGDSNELTPIDLGLVDPASPVPATTCKGVGDFCAIPQKCTAQ